MIYFWSLRSVLHPQIFSLYRKDNNFFMKWKINHHYYQELNYTGRLSYAFFSETIPANVWGNHSPTRSPTFELKRWSFFAFRYSVCFDMSNSKWTERTVMINILESASNMKTPFSREAISNEFIYSYNRSISLSQQTVFLVKICCTVQLLPYENNSHHISFHFFKHF